LLGILCGILVLSIYGALNLHESDYDALAFELICTSFLKYRTETFSLLEFEYPLFYRYFFTSTNQFLWKLFTISAVLLSVGVRKVGSFGKIILQSLFSQCRVRSMLIIGSIRSESWVLNLDRSTIYSSKVEKMLFLNCNKKIASFKTLKKVKKYGKDFTWGNRV
jgi:hypothetical protein